MIGKALLVPRLEAAVFSATELAHLGSQPMGCLATVASDGVVQNVKGGQRQVSFVVDDMLSLLRQHVRGVQVRGQAGALSGMPPLLPGFSREVIRIRPQSVLTWSVEPGTNGLLPAVDRRLREPPAQRPRERSDS